MKAKVRSVCDDAKSDCPPQVVASCFGQVLVLPPLGVTNCNSCEHSISLTFLILSSVASNAAPVGLRLNSCHSKSTPFLKWWQVKAHEKVFLACLFKKIDIRLNIKI